LYISRERTLERKIKEACLAIKLSRHWSKDRILAAWMNQVYFGNHAYGVEAAAQTYFSKPAKDLTLMEAVLLAGLPQAPSLYDPIVHPDDAAIRAMTAVYPGRAENQFNLVAQARRQAGSTFKVFVLTQAVSQGINPATTTYYSAPFHYQPNSYSPPWDVTTYSHTYSGLISIEQATLQSDNTVYAQLTLDVGPENVARMAHRLGVQ